MNDPQIRAVLSHLPTHTGMSLMASERRRYALEALLDHGHMTLPDLAEAVAVLEQNRSFAEIPEHTVLATYTGLWHCDIPKLVEAGVITYEQELDRITLKTTMNEPRMQSAD